MIHILARLQTVVSTSQWLRGSGVAEIMLQTKVGRFLLTMSASAASAPTSRVASCGRGKNRTDDVFKSTEYIHSIYISHSCVKPCASKTVSSTSKIPQNVCNTPRSRDVEFEARRATLHNPESHAHDEPRLGSRLRACPAKSSSQGGGWDRHPDFPRTLGKS